MRYPGAFSDIVVYDKLEVNVRQGKSHVVEVIAGRNLLSNIVTRISGRELIIENLNKCNFVRGYKKDITINVTVPYLHKATNNGVGLVHIKDGFSQDTLLVRAESSGDIRVEGQFGELRTSSHGNGDIYLSGSSNSLYVYAYGTNFLFADSLQLRDYAFIETYSIGDCSINARKLNTLEYNIWREGNIYYTGQPSVIRDFSGGQARGEAIAR